MSSTHRKRIARALAALTGMTYQQALAAVVNADENNRLPHALDAAGIQRAAHMLAGLHGGTNPVPMSEPAVEISMPTARDLLGRALSLPDGLIVIAGKTMTGKTTLLYDSVRTIVADPTKTVATVEDVIETRLSATSPRVHQFEHGTRTQPFATINAAVRRRDPDAIMYDEIYRADQAEAPVDAALTGHLSVATLHANNPAGVVHRLLQWGSVPENLASALSAIIITRRNDDGSCSYGVTLVNDAMRDLIRAQNSSTTYDALAQSLAVVMTEHPTETATGGIVPTSHVAPADSTATPTVEVESEVGVALAPEAPVAEGPVIVDAGPTGSGKSQHLDDAVDAARIAFWTDLGFDPVIAEQIRRTLTRRTGVMLIVATSTHKASSQAEAVLHAALEETSASRTTVLLALHKVKQLAQTAVIQEKPHFDEVWNTMLSFANLRQHAPTVIGLDALTGSWTREMFEASQSGRLVIAIGGGVSPEETLGFMLGDGVTADDVADHVAGILVLHESADLSRAGFITMDRAVRRAVREHLPSGARGKAALREALTIATVRSATPKSISMDERDHIRTSLRRLAAMLSVGMRPNEACASLAATMTGEPHDVFDRMSRADSFSQSAAAEKHVFEPWAVDMLATGERTGQLGEALDALVKVY